MAGFVHLNVYSDYSVLGGLCKVKKLLPRVAELGMDAVALTDEGNLFGAVDFYKSARGAGVKAIIGMETYVAKGPKSARQGRRPEEVYEALVLLAVTTDGYHSLCRLSTLGYLEGYHLKPRVDLEDLRQNRAGLIALSSRERGAIGRAVLNGKMEQAAERLADYVEIFGAEGFFLEVSNHGTPQDAELNAAFKELGAAAGVGLVATNQCYYLKQEDAGAHDALLCVRDNEKLDNEKRDRLPNSTFYLKSEDEMRAALPDFPEAIDNTRVIADRCNAQIPLGQNLIPAFAQPEEYTPSEYLRKLVMEGVAERYNPTPPEYIDRAEFELSVIERMKFVDYFLVVWDLINFARQNDIPVGPGRGSGAGSIVAYALRITNIDPMRYQLLFERFLNPERISMPDFDIDFCFNKREKMIEYSYATYGKENVSQIITFGRMLAKNVVRNVGRVMGMPYLEVDRIAKLVPDELKITLKDALEKEPELKKLVAEDSEVGKMWDLAMRLEGTIGNCGTHAAGVVICDHALTDHVALFKADNSETVATQVEMSGVEEVGLLKMDFLGLRTLTVVHEAARLVKEGRGVVIDPDELPTNDDPTYALLRSGMTTGIFQLESSGMRDLSKRIGLESLEEICALVALYRPGPMQFIPDYIEGKFNQEKVVYDHPLLKPILRETYGIAIYQEQVMQIVQAVAGFSLGEADILRRAMGKKKADLMAEQRQKFVDGCAKNDIDASLAGTLFDKIETFAGYGFNKSHSMCYAFVAYQTAYLKANFPVEFMCALLTSEAGNLDKTALYAGECKRIGVPVLPPDINRSETFFSVEDAPDGTKLGAIRFGLSAIKNVGRDATDAIVKERKENGPFVDIFDLCARVDSRSASRKLLESLNKAGAFVSTGWNRRQIEAVLDDALSQGQAVQRDRDAGQSSLFDLEGMEDAGAAQTPKPDLVEWPEFEILQWEKDMLGLYVSTHPLSNHEGALRNFCSPGLGELNAEDEGSEKVIGGIVAQVKIHMTSKGDKMAFLSIDTLEGPVELTVFSDTYREKSGLLQQDMIVIARARVSVRKGEAGLVAEEIYPVEEAEKQFARALHVRVLPGSATRPKLEQLAVLLGESRGPCDVYLHCTVPGGGDTVVHASSACMVKPGRALRYSIEEILGEDSVWFTNGEGFPTHRPPEPKRKEEPRWKRKSA
ncbi:MAG: DNA polymerase III subunit alpha [Candidatus Hydrogenedens sp.]|nr:DNA polymerase III subunit alpha [Candidatus Hydrogenedens sp.]